MNKEVIFFTGGGSGGHVVPALTLIKSLDRSKYNVHYIGSKEGIEASLTRGTVDSYHSIKVGKLRRYISFQNFLDLFNILIGLIQSIFLIFRLKSANSAIISMGGFVSVPTVIAAKINGLKVYIHEQTSRVGLANKICSKFADKVFVSFEESLKFFPKEKTIMTGYPVRESFYKSTLEHQTVEDFNFVTDEKKLIFITGGGNGSFLINEKVKEALDELMKDYIIVHQVGKSFIEDFSHLKSENYLPLAFIGEEMPSLFKAADIVISRAGAGTVCELMALKKSSIFIPLKIAQKNEQFHNAMEANKKLGSLVVTEDEFSNKSLLELIRSFKIDKEKAHTEELSSKAVENIFRECDLVLNKSI